MQETLIYDAIRSPRAKAKPNGGLAQLTPLALLKQLYNALEQRNDLDPMHLDDVLLGCVSQYGEQGGTVARASVVYANWPDQLPGLTVNRF